MKRKKPVAGEGREIERKEEKGRERKRERVIEGHREKGRKKRDRWELPTGKKVKRR